MDVWDIAHRNVLKARNIEHLVSTEHFKNVFDASSPETKSEIIAMVSNGNYQSLRRVLHIDTLRELRLKASRLGIKDYTQFSKCVLQDKIEEKYKERIDSLIAKHGPVPERYIIDNDYEGLKLYLKETKNV